MLAHEVKFDGASFAIIPVSIRHRKSPAMATVDYKVDSGANCTTIGAKRLFGLGFDESWVKSGKRLEGSARPTLASGVPLSDCYEIVLPEISIGNWVGYNWPMLTSLSAPFRFLLGTDSMQFFDWHFDYKSGFCRFYLIPERRRLLLNQKEQSIHAADKSET